MRKFIPLFLILVFALIAADAEGQLLQKLKGRFGSWRGGATERALETTADVTVIAGMQVAIWSPPESYEEAPLVIFSHGFGGCKTQSSFLMEALAANGFIVAAPDHKDASCGNIAGGIHRPAEKFRDYDAWSDKTYADRASDVKKLYAALQADRAWSKKINFDKFAVAGHSLGGYTAIGLAGGWPSWKMDGIKAVLALSPYVGPYLHQGTLAKLSAPVMYQGGTKDRGITPTLNRKGGAFEQTSSPAMYVEFDKTTHFGWTDLQSDSHDRVILYSLWFLDHALNGTNIPIAKEPGVKTLLSK